MVICVLLVAQGPTDASGTRFGYRGRALHGGGSVVKPSGWVNGGRVGLEEGVLEGGDALGVAKLVGGVRKEAEQSFGKGTRYSGTGVGPV